MYLEIAEYSVPLHETERNSVTSKFTGNKLETIIGEALASDEKIHEEIKTEINNHERFSLYDDNDDFLGEWNVRISQWSMIENRDGTQYRYVLELSEMEDYEVESISIDGVKISVSSFEERIDLEDTLTFHFNTESLEENKEEKIFELWQTHSEYFPVMRNGVDDEPKDMRLGQVFWSEESDKKRFNITLVEREYDEKNEGYGFNRIDLPDTNARGQLAYLLEFTDNLVGTLFDKDLLTEDELKDLEDQAEEKAGKRLFDFFEVSDVEKLT